MAAGQGAEQYIELADFSQGIASGWRLPNSPNAADGAAQITDTFGCVAAQGGGLEAAPRISYLTSYSQFKVGNTVPAPTSWNKNVRVHDFQTAPSYAYAAWGVTSPAAPPDAMISVTEHWASQTAAQVIAESSPAGNQTVANTGVYRVYRGWYGTYAAPFNYRTGFINGYSTGLHQTGTPTLQQWGVASAQFMRSAMAGSLYTNTLRPAGYQTELTDVDPTFPGVMMPVFHAIYPHPTAGTWVFAQSHTAGYPYAATWPSATNYVSYFYGWSHRSNVTATDDNAPAFPLTRLYAHQERLVCSSLFTEMPTYNTNTRPPYGDIWMYANQQHTFSDDLLFFHDKNAIQYYDANFNYIQPDGRKADMVGAMASMNQSDLYGVRANRGGFIIRGDMLNSPVVQQIPGVVSTGPYPHRPVVTPLGMIYGTPFGVFAWNGGDVSQSVSPLLESAFWLIPGTHERNIRSPLTSVGTFAFKYPFVYAPNNWIMDIRNGGWFRVHPTTDLTTDNTLGAGYNIGHWAAGSADHMWGMPLEITTEGRNANLAMVGFDHTLGALNWSWKSQPLVKTVNRFVKFREMNATVQGNGFFSVTLEGADGASQTVAFEVNSNSRPVLVTLPLAIDAQDVVVKIISQGRNSSTDAPSLRKINFGYQTTRSI